MRTSLGSQRWQAIARLLLLCLCLFGTSLAAPAAHAAPSDYDEDGVWDEGAQEAIAKARELAKRNAQAAQINRIMAESITVGSIFECVRLHTTPQHAEQLQNYIEKTHAALMNSCKKNTAEETKRLAMQAIKRLQPEPIIGIAATCYSSQRGKYAAIAGEEFTTQVDRYLGLLRNPALTEKDISIKELCG